MPKTLGHLYSTKVEDSLAVGASAAPEPYKGAGDDFAATMHAELGIGVAQMLLDGVFTDGERVGDLLVGKAAPQITNDFRFAPRQVADRIRLDPCVIRGVDVLEQQPDEQRSWHPHLALLDAANSFDAILGRSFREQEPVEPITYDLLGECRTRVISDEKNASAGPTRTKVAHGATAKAR